MYLTNIYMGPIYVSVKIIVIHDKNISVNVKFFGMIINYITIDTYMHNIGFKPKKKKFQTFKNYILNLKKMIF